MVDQLNSVLILGNAAAAEMQPLLQSIHQQEQIAEIRHYSNSTAVIDAVSTDGWHPDLVVVLQQWPDEFSAHEVQQLLQLMPLARWICCFGAWCAADGRNRDIWPLAVRIAAEESEARLQQELAVLRGKQAPLPLTASRDEIFEFDSPQQLPAEQNGELVFVESSDAQFGRCIADSLSANGYRIADSLEEQSLAAVVWDVDPWYSELVERISAYSRRNPHVAIVAMMNFANPEDVVTVKACGANALVAKLAPSSCLLQALAATCSRKHIATM